MRYTGKRTDTGDTRTVTADNETQAADKLARKFYSATTGCAWQLDNGNYAYHGKHENVQFTVVAS